MTLGLWEPFGLIKPAGRRFKPPQPPAPAPHEGPEPAPKDEKPKQDKVVLRNPKWDVDDVGFNEETDISVEAELPESQAHKTRVTFELFAKVPGKPERISQAEGQIADGDGAGTRIAKAKIPVYIPQYRDEQGDLLTEVDYYFTAKHSASDLLSDDTVVKHVDHMANLVIQCHILEDVTFATGKSQVRQSQVPALKALVDRIAKWRKDHPDGKLAVFGHTDAVGKEDYNKTLSEKRAKAIHAFLVKDGSVWDALAKEEQWKKKDDFDHQAFMDEHNTLALADKDFDAIDGAPHMGCSEFNLVEKKDGASEPNRRVTVFLLKTTKNFPIQYPCKRGDIAPCQAQVKAKGGRRTPGFSCRFYDKLTTEQPGACGPKGTVRFVGITEAVIKQYVNLDPDAAKPELGLERKIEVEVQGLGEGDEVYWTVTLGKGNSARTEPKVGPKLKSEDEPVAFTDKEPEKAPDAESGGPGAADGDAGTDPGAADGEKGGEAGKGDAGKADGGGGKPDKVASLISTVAGGKSHILLRCGPSGGDEFIVEAGGSRDKMDCKVTVVAWRRLEYETIHPKAEGGERLTDYTYYRPDKGPGLSDGSVAYLDKALAGVFVEFKEVHKDVFLKSDYPEAGKYNIVDAKCIRRDAGSRALIATMDQMDLATFAYKKNDANPRSVSITWCDYIVERKLWRETYKEITGDKYVAPTGMMVFERAIDSGAGYGHGDYFIKSIKWAATDWLDGSTWKPITGHDDPGYAFKGGGTISSEAEIKEHIEYVDAWSVQIKWPATQGHYPGKKIHRDGGHFVDKGKRLRLSLQVDGVGWTAGFNGLAFKGKIWMNSFGGTQKDPVGVAIVIAHELGHNMGQGYGGKDLSSFRGRKEAIPGIPFPKYVPEGNIYVDHGHRGVHCANGIKDKTAADYSAHWADAMAEHTCIMFGAMDMNSAKEFAYCEECTPYIRGEVLTDIRKDWT